MARRRTVSLKPGTLPGKPKKKKRKNPAEKLRDKKASEVRDAPLSEKLTRIAAATPRSRGKIGAAVSGGLSGAALGALLGETLSKKKKERK